MKHDADWDTRRAEALRLHRAGDHQRAGCEYDQLLDERPDAADVHELRGILHAQCGRPDLALGSIGRAIEIDGTVPRFHSNLGTTMLKLGRTAEAVQCLARACELEPESNAAAADYGRALLESGRPEAAYRVLKKLAERDPGNATVHANVGDALMALSRSEEAIVAYVKALALNSDLAGAWYNLGCVLSSLSRHQEARPAFARALTLEPSNAAAHLGLAEALRSSGRHDEALDAYHHAIAAGQDSGAVLLNLGHLCHEMGRLDESAATYRRVLEIEPENAAAWIGLAELHRFRPGDTELVQLEALADRDELDAASKTSLCFALAKARHDLGDLEGAFSSLQKGNRLKRASFRYSVSADEDRMARICAEATSEVCAGLAAGGLESAVPIFIVGMPRSGSTLVEQILASHPQVHGAGELGDFQRLVLRELPHYPVGLMALPPARISAMAGHYLQVLAAIGSSARRVTDKLPANFEYIGLIHACFPRAAIILCARDPLDTTFSCYRKLFVGAQHFAYDLEELGRYFRAYRRLIDHWHHVLPGRVHTLSYEALIDEPEVQIRRLLEYCELPWAADCLAFHLNHRYVQTASTAQVRKPLNDSSIGSGKRYAAHLHPLIEALGIPAVLPVAHPPTAGHGRR